MSLTSGMCSALDPEFNIWDAIEPYAGQLIREESGNVVQAFAKQALSVAGGVARLPQRLDDLTTRIEEGRVVDAEPPARTSYRSTSSASGGGSSPRCCSPALLIGGILLRADDAVFGTVLIVGVGAAAAARPVRRIRGAARRTGL